jgi:DNA polymerase III delta subunit
MPEPKRVLIFGDPYRCGQALDTRHAAILAEFADTERNILFGDELDLPSLRMTVLSSSLFVQGRHFVIRHAEAVPAPKPFATLLKEELPEATFLTLVAEEIEPSNPILKAIRDGGSVQALPRVKGKALEGAVSEILAEQDLKLTPAALKELVAQSGGDLLSVTQEARKLHAFAPEGALDENAIARLRFAAGERSIYPLLDRLGEGNLRASLAALSDLHEDSGRIFSVLLRHLTRLVMVRALADAGATAVKAATLLGSPAWLVKRLLKQAGRRSTQDLSAVVDQGITLDLMIKRGEIRPGDALLKLILAATTPASTALG